MSDWLCQDCKSVNSSGARNCYRCWTPRKFGEAPDPATLPPGVTVEQAHEERKRELRPSVAHARSSRRRSWIVLACITGTVAFSALSLAFVGAKGGSLGVALSLISGDWTVMGSLLAISLVGGVLALAAMIAWFVWFDRVLANIPSLTGTWPEVSRVMAVVWWLVPVIGQFKGTFVVGHVYGLMAVAGSPGLWLLGLWGITWIGGTLAPGVAGFIVGWLPLPLEEAVNLQDLIANVGQICYIAAGFFAAALILALEHARDVRMAGQADAAAVEPEVSLADRLDGRSSPTPSTPAWSAAPAPWPPGPDTPPAWPAPSTDWPQPSAPGFPTSSVPPGLGTQSVASLGAHALTSPTSGQSPQAPTRTRAPDTRQRPPVPFEPILLMGALVLAGVVGGITMAGMYDPMGTLGRLGGGQDVRPTATPWPSPHPAVTAAPHGSPGASPIAPSRTPLAVGSTSAPQTPASPVATPTPVPADLVLRRLMSTVTDDRYRGLMDIEATYLDDTGDTAWTLRVGRVGGREYRRQTVERPDTDPEVVERAALDSSVWERAGRDDWSQRRKTDRDRATPPLFDVTSASQLTPDGTVDEDGERYHRFTWKAGDSRLRQFVRDLGGAQDLELRSGELLTTAAGIPVRLELRFAGDESDATLRMTIDYSEVGGNIQVRSPRVGPPLVVRG